MKRTYSKEIKVKACELVLKDGIKHRKLISKSEYGFIFYIRKQDI